MGAGFAQIGMLILLTIVGLPLFFFALMAALDRFEGTLSASPRTVSEPVKVADIGSDANVVTLPSAGRAVTSDGAAVGAAVAVGVAATSAAVAPSGAGAAKPAAAI